MPPYFSIEDLPLPVQHSLPKKAQEIYRKAFNRTWDHFRNPTDLPSDTSRVEIAAKIAWTAVKQEYEKAKNGWKKKKINKKKES